MHETSFQDFGLFAAKYLVSGRATRIADIGSFNDNGTYRPWLEDTAWNYTGFDIRPGPNVDVVFELEYDWKEVPDAAFDVVISGQVLEHVQKPWRWMPEVSRILKQSGLVYISAPNTWVFHEHPRDCWRVWPDGLHGLFDDFGIETIEAYVNGADTTAIGRKR